MTLEMLATIGTLLSAAVLNSIALREGGHVQGQQPSSVLLPLNQWLYHDWPEV